MISQTGAIRTAASPTLCAWIYQRTGSGADGVVAELAEHAAAEIPGDYAGITATNSRFDVDTPAATHRYAVVLDDIQRRYREGPCVTSGWERKTVHIADLEADTRWPKFRRDALKSTPARSIMGFQLFMNSLA